MDRASLIAQLSRQAGITTTDAARIVDALFDPARGLLARSAAEGPVRLTGFVSLDLVRGHVGPGVEYEIQIREPVLIAYEAVDVTPAIDEAVIAISVDLPPAPDAPTAIPPAPDLVERGPRDDAAREFTIERDDPVRGIGGAAMDVHGSGQGGRD